MNNLADKVDGVDLVAAWQRFDQITQLRPINSEADYDHVVGLMNRVLDVMGDDEHHPLSGLLVLLAEMVSGYDKIHYSVERL